LSHRRIYEAIRDRRPVEAQQAMYFHLMYNENRYKEEDRERN
jgi:DNA-binding FadR family transcriptional regulator